MAENKPDPDLVIRDLEDSDYHKGYLHCLSYLTTVGNISEEAFKKRLGSYYKLRWHFCPFFDLLNLLLI